MYTEPIYTEHSSLVERSRKANTCWGTSVCSLFSRIIRLILLLDDSYRNVGVVARA